jgi:hypothetical protein
MRRDRAPRGGGSGGDLSRSCRAPVAGQSGELGQHARPTTALPASVPTMRLGPSRRAGRLESRERGLAADERPTMLDLTTVIANCPHDAAVPTGYVPALAVIHLPADVNEACELLASTDQFEPLRDGSLSAALDVPPGMWRYWPARRVAFWLGARRDACPSLRADARLDLYDVVLRLGRHGYLLRDLKVHGPDGWGSRRRAGAALRSLANDPFADAVRGVWADPAGRAVRLEIHTTGAMAAQESDAVWTLAEAVGAALND